MKNTLFLLISLFTIQGIQAQVSGNANYNNQVRFPDRNINIGLPGNADIVISVKGLSNVKADAYVAVFSISQTGKTAAEVNSIIDGRIDDVLNKIKNKAGLKHFIDMISFVPIYEYEVEKKIFSKRTYNEVPKGFELKKNLHIQFKNADFLNELIGICAASEIYDLVKVDYVSENLGQKKKDLVKQAKLLLQEKLKNHEEILAIDLDSLEKDVADGFKVIYPIEAYQFYQAFSSTEIKHKKSGKVNTAEKTTTQYYQAIVDKEFDFVINPLIVEPAIQVLYELKLRVKRPIKNQTKVQKEYFFISPDGAIKSLPIGN